MQLSSLSTTSSILLFQFILIYCLFPFLLLKKDVWGGENWKPSQTSNFFVLAWSQMNTDFFFFPYLSLLGPEGTILQDELSALQNYLKNGYNKRWVPARTPDMSTSHPCRGVGILTSGLAPFCQDWKPWTSSGLNPKGSCLWSDFWDEQPAVLGQQILKGTIVKRL